MNRILFVNGQVFDGTGTPPPQGKGLTSMPTIEPVSDALDLIAEAVAGRVRLGAGAR